MALWHVCAFCGRRFPGWKSACSKCRFPVDGDLTSPSAARAPGRPRAESCSHCGKRFPAGRKACPHCGADHETGWKSAEDQDHDGTDIPDTFTRDDYRRTLAEIRPGRARTWTRRQRRLAIAGIVLVLSMTVPMLVLLWRHFR